MATTVGLLLIALRTVYSLTDSGRFRRTLNALQGHEDGAFDATLTRLDLLPPLPEGWQRDLVMFDMLKSIRDLTLDEYASLLDNETLRTRAVEALVQAGDTRAIRCVFVHPQAAWRIDSSVGALLARYGDRPFLAMLNDSDPELRRQLVDFLASGHPEEAGNPLDTAFRPLLNDPDPDVRIAAAEFLGKRRNKDAVSCLIGEFNRLAQDEPERSVWLRQARRGQITADEFLTRRRRFTRITSALDELDDPQASAVLQAHAKRQAQAAERKKAEALDRTFDPSDKHWRLYVHLVPRMPDYRWYQVSTTPVGQSLDPPYIVPARSKASSQEIMSKFGAPDRKDASAVWETQFGQGRKNKIQGVAWVYGDELEILIVEGYPKWVKTSKPDARILFGGVMPETKPSPR